MVHNNWGEFCVWELCVLFLILLCLLSFKCEDCGTAYAFYATNVINVDEKFYQDIFVNYAFHLWVRSPPRVLLEVTIFSGIPISCLLNNPHY